MGCAESREQTPLLTNYDSQDPPPMPLRMGQPTTPLSHSNHNLLSTQHERLILELLPCKDLTHFHEWLTSVYIHGSWLEYLHDFLSRNPLAPEPDKAKIAQLAKDAVNSHNSKYLTYHPIKDGWTAEDHHIRFMACVITDNLLSKGLWTESEWKKRGLDIAKAVYEVLSFLRGTIQVQGEGNPPGYDG